MCSFIDDKTNRISSWYMISSIILPYIWHILSFFKVDKSSNILHKMKKKPYSTCLEPNPFFHGPFAIIAAITTTYIQFLIFRLALLRCTTTRNYFSNSSLNDQRPWDSKDPTLNILSINGFTT